MIELVLDVLAVFRLTRILVDDALTQSIRGEIVRWAYGLAAVRPPFECHNAADWDTYSRGDPDAPLLAKLITCRWCMSVYVAAFAFGARVFAPALWARLRWVMALSAGAGLLSQIDES